MVSEESALFDYSRSIIQKAQNPSVVTAGRIPSSTMGKEQCADQEKKGAGQDDIV